MSKNISIVCLLLVVIIGIKANEDLKNMFVKRCDDKLPKDKVKEYEKCDSQASDDIKETVKKCVKDICNKDGKFNKPDVCCYAIKPNAMFECFEKTIQDVEEKDSKSKGLKADELQKKNSHNAAMIVECYEEIDDD